MDRRTTSCLQCSPSARHAPRRIAALCVFFFYPSLVVLMARHYCFVWLEPALELAPFRTSGVSRSRSVGIGKGEGGDRTKPRTSRTQLICTETTTLLVFQSPTLHLVVALPKWDTPRSPRPHKAARFPLPAGTFPGSSPRFRSRFCMSYLLLRSSSVTDTWAGPARFKFR